MRTLTAPAMALLITLAALGCGNGEGTAPAEPIPTPPPRVPEGRVTAPEPILLPPTATPHPTLTPAPAPVEEPAGTPWPTEEPAPDRRGGETTGTAEWFLDSGLALAEAGLHGEAIQNFTEAARLMAGPSPLLEQSAGISQAALGRHSEAVEHFSAAILGGDGPELRARRALSLRETGQCPAAIRDGRTALATGAGETPRHGFHAEAEAHRALALCHSDLGKPKRALAHAESALEAALAAGYHGDGLSELERLAAEIQDTLPAEPNQEATPTPAGQQGEEPTAPQATPTPTPPVTPRPDGPRLDLRLEEVGNMEWVKRHAPKSFRAIREFPWVKDGLWQGEADALEELGLLLAADGLRADAGRVVLMPFLETIDLGEAETLEAMRRLAGEHPRVFRSIMEGPPVTDEAAPLIAVMPGLAGTDPDLAERLLRPGVTLTETGLVRARGKGMTRMNVIRLEGDDGSPGAMGQLEGAVRTVSQFMEAPLPTGSVNLLIADAAGLGPAGAANHGTGIIAAPGTEEGQSPGRAIARGVAGYYWSGNAPWLDAGMSEYLAAVTEEQTLGRRLGTAHYPCGEYGSIAEMPERTQPHHCDHALGSRLVLDLEYSVGRPDLREKMRELHRLPRDGKGRSIGIEDLKERFKGGSHDENQPHIHGGEAITRWHGGGREAGHQRADVLDDAEPDPEIHRPRGMVRSMGIIVDGAEAESFTPDRREAPAVVRVEYGYEATPGDERRGRHIELEMVVIHEDGIPILGPPILIPVREGNIGGRREVAAGPPPGLRWAAGSYRAYLYGQGRKMAETAWTVGP